MTQHLFSLLKQTSTAFPEHIAYAQPEQRMDYAQLCELAEAVGSLVAQTVPPRSAVAVVADARSTQCVCVMMGVLAAGCFYAPLDPNLPEERLRLIMENLQPALIIADQNTSAKAVSAYPKAHCICASEALQTPMDKKLIQERSEAIEPDDLSMVLYTSGSTGIPKGVAHSHRGMVTWAKATVKRYGFTQDTVFASISPFYYANSLLELFVPMLLGAKVVMIPPSYLTFPKQLISCLQNEGVTELCMTPSSFVVVANSGVLMKGLLPDLDMFIMSGEVMPKVQLKCWMDAAPRAAAMNFYGSTETLSVAVNPVTSPDAEGILPVGRLFPGVTLRLVAEDGREAMAGETGEIFVQSPMLSVGYYRDAERTQASFVSDPLGLAPGIWFRTGDYGVLDEDGMLSVLGRTDTMIKHHGYRMELGEVEAAARQTPGCMEACCLLDSENDEIWCFVSGDLQGVKLSLYLKTRLAKYMLPDYYMVLQEMPHNANMKIDRRILRRMMSKTTDE
jgi:amino acid adenylation domain-containing protein